MSWREELPEGYDVFFTETLAARSVARVAKQKFRATIKESATLFGRKNGQDIYRVTFCLRFPRPAPARPAGTSPAGAMEQ
jgi:NMD protein affecting ribosome stability and mRNA decay